MVGRIRGSGAPGSPDEHDAVGRRGFVAGAAAVGLAGLAGCATETASESGKQGSSPSGGGPAPAAGTAGAPRASATGLTQSGLTCTGARMLWVTVPVDETAAAPLVPPGLRLQQPAAASVFVADYPMTNFESVYREAAIMLHIEDDEGPAWHCPWIIVDDDTALILGREVTGFPKQLGEITLDERGQAISGVGARRGTELVRIEADKAAMSPQAGGVWTQRLIHVNGTLPGGMRLQHIKPLTERVHERSVGTATLTLGSSARDDLRPLVPQPVTGPATFAVLDFGSLSDGGPASGEPLPLDWAYRRQMNTAI